MDRATARACVATGFVAIALAVGGAHGDTIRLKSSARMPADRTTVHLGDVAELDGPEAERLAGLPIAELTSFDRPLEIPIRDVRARLDESGVHWGRVHLGGKSVLLRPASRSAAAPVAMTSVSLGSETRSDPAESAPAQRDDPQPAADLVKEATLRGAVAREMVHRLRVHAADLRLAFERADRERLDRPRPGARFELTPLDGERSPKVTFTVREWSRGRVVENHRIRCEPFVRARTAVLARDVRRNELLAEGDYDAVEAWLSPAEAARGCPPAAAAGRLASRSLNMGHTLRRGELRSPTVVERGDRVMVRCLVGGVVISLPATARDDGVGGETIEFQKIGERHTFLATVTGRGEAVIDLSRATP